MRLKSAISFMLIMRD